MNALIGLLVVVLGIAVVGLGAKGFSKTGLPLTPSKSVGGATARVIGSICMLLGLLWILYGLWTLVGGR